MPTNRKIPAVKAAPVKQALVKPATSNNPVRGSSEGRLLSVALLSPLLSPRRVGVAATSSPSARAATETVGTIIVGWSIMMAVAVGTSASGEAVVNGVG